MASSGGSNSDPNRPAVPTRTARVPRESMNAAFNLKATVPGGWSHLRENPRAGVRRRNWLGAGGPVVVLRLPGVLVCGMMARAAHDAGASLGYEPV